VSAAEAFPNSGKLFFGDFRKFVIRTCPYLIVYRVRKDAIIVEGVLDARQDPKRMRRKLRER
jgi:hypothetical protein